MLPVLTPSPVSPAAAGQRPDEIPIALRLNQRLAAEVLQIAADHVVLALEGVPVVARLTSPDQAAMLAERRVAQFIVRGLSDQSLTLQLVHPETAPPPPPASSLAGLIPSLLEQAGLPVNPANTQIARALIERGLPVTPELVAELESALAGLVEHRRRVNEFVDTRPGAQAAPWNQADAQAAAALRAAGLPLSPGTLALARTQPAPLAETLARLQAQLESLSALPLPPRQAELARGALETLAKIRVDWSQPAPALAAQLREAVAILGRAVEHDLAKLLTAISDQSARSADSALRLKPQPDLLGLAQLSGELKGAVPQARTLIGEIDRFLDAARLAQFANAAPDGVPARRESDDATTINLSLPLGRPDQAPAAAHLRVAYRPDGEADPREPGRERLATLVLRVELERGQSLEVELSVVERQVGARVTASHGDLRDRAEAELPGLAIGLRNLGFTLKTARFEVGQAGGEKAKDDRRSKTELAA